jgi:hypothetical protein
MEVKYDYNPEFDFSRLKTFAIIYPEADGVKSLNQERIAAALANELQLKGYKKVPRERADFYLTFHTNVTDKTQVVTDYQRIGMYPYRFRYGGPAVIPVERTYSYTEGKIIVDALDPAQKEIFWRAIATDRLKNLKTPEERTSYI